MREPNRFQISRAFSYRTLSLRPRQVLNATTSERGEISWVHIKERASINRLIKQPIRRNAFRFKSGDKPVARGAAECLCVVLENELIDGLPRQSLILTKQRNTGDPRKSFGQLLRSRGAKVGLLR